MRQKQQIQDQAKTIEDLQHQLERQKEKSGYPGSEAPSHNQVGQLGRRSRISVPCHLNVTIITVSLVYVFCSGILQF